MSTSTADPTVAIMAFAAIMYLIVLIGGDPRRRF